MSKLAIFVALVLLSISSVQAQDTGIQDNEKLLVWRAVAPRPGEQTASAPGQLVWIDSEGNFNTFMDLPLQTTHVMVCGQTSAVSPDGESLAFYVGKDVGTLYILRGTDNRFVVDDNFHVMGCTGQGSFEFFPDSSKFAYLDYNPDSLLGSYGEGVLRIYNNNTFEEITSFESVIEFDLEGDNLAYIRFFEDNQNEPIQASIMLWDGETDQEVAVLFAKTDCNYTSASIELLPTGDIVAILGHRCSTGDSRTNWQYILIDPENFIATRIQQGGAGGAFFAFSRTNSIFSSPDGNTTFFTVPDAFVSHTAGLNRISMDSMFVTPVIENNIAMPRNWNNPFALENHHPTIQSSDDIWLAMVRTPPSSEPILSLLDLSQPDLPPIDIIAGERGDQIIEVEFTPDNNHVLYVAGGNYGDDNSLWLVDLTTGNNSRISRGRYGQGVVSPDGERIALIKWEPTAGNKPPYATLVVVDVKSGEETVIFNGSEIVNDELTGVRFALPIAWRR